MNKLYIRQSYLNWAIACFKFFASLKLAVFLLIVLGIVFGVGTFIESYHGGDAAKVLIYRTPWLAFLLISLALNLLASALDRIHWKKKHVGFLTTHFGIILILFGSLISQAFGIEGQLQIQEGRTESRITLAEPILQAIAVDSGDRWIYGMDQHVFAWKGRRELFADGSSELQVHLRIYYPKAKLLERVKETDSGFPALHVALRGSMATVDRWLFLDDPARSSVNLGPAVIRFTTEPIEDREHSETHGMGKLRFDFENEASSEIELDQKSIGKTFPIEGTPYRVLVKRILKDAVVEQKELIDRSNEWRNPAVELLLEGGGFSERHTVFPRFPEFPTLHGLKPSEARVRIAYQVPGFSEGLAANEIRFIRRAKHLPGYQVKHEGKVTGGEVELEKEVETGWMDFKFTVDSYFEHADLDESYAPLPVTSTSLEAVSVIQAEFEAKGEKKSLWLPQGEIVHVRLGGSDYHVMYGLKTKPLGFHIELQDFIIETDPGTDRPASFKSLVALKDSGRGIHRDQIIQMNEPLKHRGFKVYQTAYQLVPGEPDVSIFTVARDPGNPLKYAGAVIMIAGIAVLFYVKPFSTLKSSDPKLRNK